jgi:hypothetical protein
VGRVEEQRGTGEVPHGGDIRAVSWPEAADTGKGARGGWIRRLMLTMLHRLEAKMRMSVTATLRHTKTTTTMLAQLGGSLAAAGCRAQGAEQT